LAIHSGSGSRQLLLLLQQGHLEKGATAPLNNRLLLLLLPLVLLLVLLLPGVFLFDPIGYRFSHFSSTAAISAWRAAAALQSQVCKAAAAAAAPAAAAAAVPAAARHLWHSYEALMAAAAPLLPAAAAAAPAPGPAALPAAAL
jgi:hypothetical protein